LILLCAENPYWAKNIIFLLTDFEEVGLHAWLEAYHGTSSPCEILSSFFPSFYLNSAQHSSTPTPTAPCHSKTIGSTSHVVGM
jgi:hypothetical protein